MYNILRRDFCILFPDKVKWNLQNFATYSKIFHLTYWLWRHGWNLHVMKTTIDIMEFTKLTAEMKAYFKWFIVNRSQLHCISMFNIIEHLIESNQILYFISNTESKTRERKVILYNNRGLFSVIKIYRIKSGTEF